MFGAPGTTLSPDSPTALCPDRRPSSNESLWELIGVGWKSMVSLLTKSRKLPDLESVMPTYEYVCTKCRAQFDVSQRMSDEPLTQCPKEVCPGNKWGKGRVKRGVGGGAGLLFKGSGFYITDYRSSGYKSSAASDSGSSGGSKPATPPKPSAP